MREGLDRHSGTAALVFRALLRRVRWRLRMGPRHKWRFAGRVPGRVRIAPPDLRLADAQIAHEIYSSRFPLAGHVVDTGGVSPFEYSTDHAGWVKALNSFRWLRHLTAAGTDLAAYNARALVADWIRQSGADLRGPAWEPGTTAKRVIAWLQHSPLILGGAELPFYRSFLVSLATQIRYLRAVAGDMDLGKDRLRVRVAVAFASLSLPNSAAAIRAAARNLNAELETQIFSDGGHISRNPLTVMELLADLLPLRQTYVNQAEPPPPHLPASIDRMMQALKFFRHANGSLARFNGMGMTIQERTNLLLRHDDPAAMPATHMPDSGYDRLALGQTIIVVDTGTPPPAQASGSAHAGCLSFEMSSGRAALVVNCGVDSYGPADVRMLARATAAHSTATIEHTSQGRFDHPARLRQVIGSPLLGGPSEITRQRFDRPEEQVLVAGHDAYVERFGLNHWRELRLGNGGATLSGIDRFQIIREGLRGDRPVAAVVRFHLHPDVEIFRSGPRIGLVGVGETAWLFECDGAEVQVEESIFFAAGSGPRPTSQLAAQIADCRDHAIAWRFQRQRN